jgi:hypothetical protein
VVGRVRLREHPVCRPVTRLPTCTPLLLLMVMMAVFPVCGSACPCPLMSGSAHAACPMCCSHQMGRHLQTVTLIIITILIRLTLITRICISRPSCPWLASHSACRPDLLTVIPAPSRTCIHSDGSFRLIRYPHSHSSRSMVCALTSD